MEFRRAGGRAERRWVCSIAAMLVVLGAIASNVARAQTVPAAPEPLAAPPDPYHELETNYLFGFTEGADIGAEGEKSIEFESTAELGLRGGHYGSLEQEVEFEGVPSQFWAYELSAHTMGYAVHDVDGLANAQGVNFSGLSAEFRYLVIGRGPGSPFGLTFSVEPEWGRVDDTGQVVTDYNTTFRAIIDTEVVPNRLYAAANLLYDPDLSQSPGQPWRQAVTWGATAGLAYRLTPKITAGGEAEYYRAYDSLGLQSLAGQAFYLGPTLHIQFTGQIMLAAAWSTEVAGRATGQNFGLDLTNFPQQRGNLKLEFEF